MTNNLKLEHIDKVMGFYSLDFLKQIKHPNKKLSLKYRWESIVNDLDLSCKFNCYLIKQLSGFLPVILENEN